ncbi:MAG: MotA/TolQ/ExbB proton channel family protein [Oceanospirillaceae bacterium]|nr:MotA/TolQ/ExbB proton channel family protein [Oceanospirillaceae bacterium]
MSKAEELLQIGGPVVWILLGFSVIALTLILVKSWQLWWAGRRVERIGDQVLGHWQRGEIDTASGLLTGVKQPGLVLLRDTLDLQSGGVEEALIREELERRFTRMSDQLRTGLRPLELIGSVSPLLGLLGTVFGMIMAFQQMELAGSQIDPGVLSGGIWQALLTTAAGLVVAIPVVLLHNGLDQWVYRLTRQMQDLVTRAFTQPTMGHADTSDQIHLVHEPEQEPLHAA